MTWYHPKTEFSSAIVELIDDGTSGPAGNVIYTDGVGGTSYKDDDAVFVTGGEKYVMSFALPVTSYLNKSIILQNLVRTPKFGSLRYFF